MGCFHSKQREEALAAAIRPSPNFAPVVENGDSHDASPTAEISPPDNNDNNLPDSNSNDNDSEHISNKDALLTTLVMKCGICFEKIPELLQATVSRPCSYHNSPVCNDCLRTLFLNACKDETRMPAACCDKSIPIRYGRRVLSAEEMALYQAKYEEWSTANRLYCPVPTCSAFIAPRLFPNGGKLLQHESGLVGGGEGGGGKQAVIPAGVQTPPPTPPDEASTTVACPQCSVRVCISCKQLSHPGDPCPEVSDIPPELEALLKTWGIKRCPRCHAAVRRMYGCRHMRCRCGAQWCWWCTGPIKICQAQGCSAEQEGEALEDDMNEEAEDYFEFINNHSPDEVRAWQQNGDGRAARVINLDAGYNWSEVSLDSGGEPDPGTHPFSCTHIWDNSYSTLDSDYDDDDQNRQDECSRCWRPLIRRPEGYLYLGLEEFLNTGTMKEIPVEEFPRIQDFANLCSRCGIVLCPDCRELDQLQQ